MQDQQNLFQFPDESNNEPESNAQQNRKSWFEHNINVGNDTASTNSAPIYEPPFWQEVEPDQQFTSAKTENPLISGLDGLNFNIPSQQPPSSNGDPQVSQKPEAKKGPEVSRIDEVKANFKKQEQDQIAWEISRQKYDDRIQNWIGRGPIKNHIRVLLCTL